MYLRSTPLRSTVRDSSFSQQSILIPTLKSQSKTTGSLGNFLGTKISKRDTKTNSLHLHSHAVGTFAFSVSMASPAVTELPESSNFLIPKSIGFLFSLLLRVLKLTYMIPLVRNDHPLSTEINQCLAPYSVSSTFLFHLSLFPMSPAPTQITSWISPILSPCSLLNPCSSSCLSMALTLLSPVVFYSSHFPYQMLKCFFFKPQIVSCSSLYPSQHKVLEQMLGIQKKIMLN